MPETIGRRKVTPYDDAFEDLVASIMRAQGDLAVALRSTSIDLVPDGLVNRHFAWLTQTYDEGKNRHLFEADGGASPLRVRPLRNRKALDKVARDLLDDRKSLPFEPGAERGQDELVQASATRISRLVKSSFVFANPQDLDVNESWEDNPSRAHEGFANVEDIAIRSPLSVALEYLTAPSMPASRAYALLPVRNFIFETFGIFPSDLGIEDPDQTFSPIELEEALSHIWTSFRPRYWSRGRDPIPAEGRSKSGSVLRQFLAARGVLWLRFQSLDDAAAYFSEGRFRVAPAPYEFVRSSHLERLPDFGELVNEIWGIPIPIRGAETLLRGGLKFSSRRGLVIGMHGGPGTGKTSIALALGAVLAPMGIDTLFITAEETREDLEAKANGLVPDELRRLSFFPDRDDRWLEIEHFQIEVDGPPGAKSALSRMESALSELADALAAIPEHEERGRLAPKPCRALIVLDGVHDLIMAAQGPEQSNYFVKHLREFIVRCRELRALVILTAGEDWAGERAFDYLVDVAFRLTHDHISDNGRKPDRRISLAKARHQLCSVGTHGLQIGGTKGVRFSPQINYQIDRKAIWKTRLPEMHVDKKVMRRVLSQDSFERFNLSRARRRLVGDAGFHDLGMGVRLFRGSNIFLNGEGSGGKAALALKIAISPTFETNGDRTDRPERILIVSFLYPSQYYDNILRALLTLRRIEYGISVNDLRPAYEVIHLYPGNYRADQLFNRIEWMLDSAELQGEPYTTVMIDGLHNVFLQFPEIEHYSLFWPQLYASLRLRPLTIISTHTTFVLQGALAGAEYRLDDRRSEPLRHALVQKTDFRFEIDPYQRTTDGYYERTTSSSTSNIFCIRTISAINQPIPQFELMWSRDRLVLFEPNQRPRPGAGDPAQRRLDF
ncbi:ATPase domain-containing protein [Novosphingobium sp.]|uniref:ATPase domain-containing protein n=1 Tax=Novosphingobium sp. TaxID=1874826 RepID=UPI003BAC8B54